MFAKFNSPREFDFGDKTKLAKGESVLEWEKLTPQALTYITHLERLNVISVTRNVDPPKVDALADAKAKLAELNKKNAQEARDLVEVENKARAAAVHAEIVAASKAADEKNPEDKPS